MATNATRQLQIVPNSPPQRITMLPARRILNLALVSAVRIVPPGIGTWTQAGYVRFAQLRTTVNGDFVPRMLIRMYRMSNFFFLSLSAQKHVLFIQTCVLHANVC